MRLITGGDELEALLTMFLFVFDDTPAELESLSTELQSDWRSFHIAMKNEDCLDNGDALPDLF